MKWLPCFVAVCIFNVSAFGSGNVSTFGFEPPRGAVTEEDIEDIMSMYIRGINRNTHDTEPLKQEFRQKVVRDVVAIGAIELFIENKYWHLVDYCGDHLLSMRPESSQLFKEVLILLTPRLRIQSYKDRVINIIGDPKSVTQEYFKNRSFVHRMFYYGAIENARLGYTWIMTETCASICDELEILAKTFAWEEHEQFEAIIDVRRVAYGGRRMKERLSATATKVWPNLPDAYGIED
jgi:hypothetical protein